MTQQSDTQNWNVKSSTELLDNWPIHDVLVRLTEAATHLLTDHNCDAHGYEGLQHAVVAAREYASRASVAAPVDAETERIAHRRLEIALGYIKRAANRELPKLPCRVDEMTEREAAIFNVGAAAVGNLQFIARELDALDFPPSPATDAAPAIEGVGRLPFICNQCKTQQHADGICANCGSSYITTQPLDD